MSASFTHRSSSLPPGRPNATNKLLVSIGLLWGLAVFGVACLPVPTLAPPLPTDTPVPSPTLTSTPVWFPPTATPTPPPTLGITPTLNLPPTLGEVLLSDDFSDLSPWILAQTSTSSIALGNHALTLALDQPGGYLYSLRREPVLSDFYLEITASPSLCRGADEYGLLLRVSPALEFYRFSLACDGRVRLDKYFKGKASSPQPWALSGSVPPGAPSTSRIAVWTKGKEMRFYVNQDFQFSVKDPSLASGNIGVFIRSAGDNAVTVTFSDLIVRKVGE